MSRKDNRPTHRKEDRQAADGRPVGVGHPTFGEHALRLYDNGYEPVPIIPRTKRVAVCRWTTTELNEPRIDEFCRRYPDHGIGLRTGRLVAVDIDVTDPDLAHAIYRLAIGRLGETFMRVGNWPKRALLYRTEEPGPKLKAGRVEILGLGQQFVAFGVHPDTGRPYSWPDGETPLDVAFSDLPLVTRDQLEAFMAEVQALLPAPERGWGRPVGGKPGSGPAPTRDASGKVVDGRDGWLSSLAFHAVHGALDRGDALDAGTLAGLVWDRFEDETDLKRPKKDGAFHYGLGDARRKVADKLRLHRDGRLPARTAPDVPAPEVAPFLPVAEARRALDQTIADACRRILDWRASGAEAPAPQIGVRATVGLGKSVVARTHLLELQRALRAMGAPDRIAVFTPSHALAEEAAAALSAMGVRTAVHRGYERSDPSTGEALCQDLPAVKTAIAAGVTVHKAACDDGETRRCPFFERCPKQANRRDVEAADVVFAAYDALYTGVSAPTGSFGAVLIDEACWPRAVRDPDHIELGRLATESPVDLGAREGESEEIAAMVKLVAHRSRAASALSQVEGPVSRRALRANRLTADDCHDAARLELRRQRDPGLHPGMGATARAAVAAVIAWNAEAHSFARFWRTLAAFLESGGATSGRLRVVGSGATDRKEVIVEGVHDTHRSFRNAPVLHLDACLRPALARQILPRLETTGIDAEAPHMTLRLVTGGFGKSALIADPRAKKEENARRAKKLARYVDYVAWEAMRVAPRRTLVITYKHCEAAFADLPGVDTAHFNAIAGLDCWKDVGLLIVIGRPLPRDGDAARLAGALFDRHGAGGYRTATKGVLMRDGRVRAVRTIEHVDPAAEILRAAITEDELIQAIGRGRGVNRSAADPLEVQVLADVVLPLVHDSLTTWDAVRPTILQRMLLAGVAVDSPKDAALLHPDLLGGEKQAQKAFEREAFKRQIHIRDTFRGMSLKSARYQLTGTGHGRSTAWWLPGLAKDARETLISALGGLATWEQVGRKFRDSTPETSEPPLPTPKKGSP